MNYEEDSAFIDYYEVLEITEDATVADIETALTLYERSMADQLNSSFTMQSARYAINVLIPRMRHDLLASEEARRIYNQKRLDVKHRQDHPQSQDELLDDEGLDLHIRESFFFDHYNGFDTEPITNTLRGIAYRLDEEWLRARTWITDRSLRIHPLIGYLNHAALRPQLATRIEQIIEGVRPGSERHMDINEGIERCITLFNPKISRPAVAIESARFDGRVFDAGIFLSDRPAQTDFKLYHSGTRGCAFGTLESRSPWMTFQGGASTRYFALMPEGTSSEIGPDEIKIMLSFQVNLLRHKADHTAELVIRMENWEQPIERVVPVVIHVPALPPRVWFEPLATAEKPLQLSPARRGESVSVVVTPRNKGDEAYIPLSARIFTKDSDAGASPEKFRTDQPITLNVDTTNRPSGKKYSITYNIDYSEVVGAEGQTTLYLHGELLPTPWQSMLRTKEFGTRLLGGGILAFIGCFLLGVMGTYLAYNLQAVWFLFIVIPLLLLGVTQMTIAPIIVHIQRSGRQHIEKKNISPYLSWGLPLAFGFFLALACALIHNQDIGFVLGSVVGTLMGAVLGFVPDGSKT
jgi:hypothetical protein